jgi:hypothetical protein
MVSKHIKWIAAKPGALVANCVKGLVPACKTRKGVHLPARAFLLSLGIQPSINTKAIDLEMGGEVTTVDGRSHLSGLPGR